MNSASIAVAIYSVIPGGFEVQGLEKGPPGELTGREA